MKLSHAAVRNVKEQQGEKLSDGGLYLHMTATGSKIDVMTPESCLPRGLTPARREKKQTREAVLAKEREERETFEFVVREWFVKYEPTLSEKHAKKFAAIWGTRFSRPLRASPSSSLSQPTSCRLSSPQSVLAIRRLPILWRYFWR